MNRQESSVIEEKVIQIAKHYPQALYYPFKVVESNLQVNVLEADVQSTPLFNKLQMLYTKSFGNMNSWLEALDGLVYPEHRFKYWLQFLNDLVSAYQTEDGAQKKPLPKAKLQEIVKMMI